MVNFIQNVSMKDIQSGNHMDAGLNSMLIQITDSGNFPRPRHKFGEIHQFIFLDEENEDAEGIIEDSQAEEIVKLLQRALEERKHVVVHCHAGLCRSGAVAEVGVMMGFFDGERPRIPNLLVKKKLMNALGWGYSDSDKLVDIQKYCGEKYFE